MTTTRLDLTGLKCPLPALKTRKALKALKAGDFLEVHCTDPLSVIDIPNLIRETGDKVEITERAERQIVFLIEKTNGLSPAARGSPPSPDRSAHGPASGSGPSRPKSLPLAYRHSARVLPQSPALWGAVGRFMLTSTRNPG